MPVRAQIQKEQGLLEPAARKDGRLDEEEGILDLVKPGKQKDRRLTESKIKLGIG